MGEEKAVSVESGYVANGNVTAEKAEVEKKAGDVDVKDNKEEQHGVTEMEEDKRQDAGENIESQEMDLDIEEVNKSNKVEDKICDLDVGKEGHEETIADENQEDSRRVEVSKIGKMQEHPDEKIKIRIQEAGTIGEEEAKSGKMPEYSKEKITMVQEEKQETGGVGEEETVRQKLEEDSDDTTKIETGEDTQEAMGGVEAGTKIEKIRENFEGIPPKGIEEKTTITQEEKLETEGGGEEESMSQKMEEDVEQATKMEPEEVKQTAVGRVEVETKIALIEENSDGKTNNITEDKVEEEVDAEESVEKMVEGPKDKKGSRKRPRSKSAAKKDKTVKKESEEKVGESQIATEKKEKTSKSSVGENEKELKITSPSTLERPVRERKLVQRLVATIEKDTLRDFHIEKGRGTPLKDIPNVAYKLSRKKGDDTFKLLHTVLFTRRGKAAEIKSNISRFSGFVWHGDEEKQMTKIKEKLDKCVKEKLVEFCDLLDIPISNHKARKEVIIAKLIEFLVEPHATTSELLAEKDQSSKGKKRKRTSEPESGSNTPSKISSKSRKKVEVTSAKRGQTNNSPLEAEEEKVREQDEDVNGVPERSDVEMSEQAKSEGGEESGEDKGKQKHTTAKSTGDGQPTKKSKTNEASISEKASLPVKKTPAKSAASRGKNKEETSEKKPSDKEKKDTSAKKPSGKVKDDTSAKKPSSEEKDETSTKNPSGKEKKNTSSKKPSGKEKNITSSKKLFGKEEETSAKKPSGKVKDDTSAKKPSGEEKDKTSTKKPSGKEKKDTSSKKRSGKEKDETSSKKLFGKEEETSTKKHSAEEKNDTSAKKRSSKKKDESIERSSAKKKDDATKKSSGKTKSESIEKQKDESVKKSSGKKKDKSKKNDESDEKSSVKEKDESILKSCGKKKDELMEKSPEKQKDEAVKKSSSMKKDEAFTKSSGQKTGESVKKSSSKKNDESIKKPISPKKLAPKSTGKKVPKETPSDEQFRPVICEILKEVDFNKVTFTDILKLLAKRFDMDLAPMKAPLKLMIQDELMKLADANDEDEDEAQKDEDKPSSSKGIKVA